MRTLRISESGVERAAREAAEVLREGGIVLYPTDTLYGLAVDAENRDAVARLALLKVRDARKAVSVVMPSVADIERYAEVLPEAKRLIDTYLPGPLTLVLPCTDPRLAHLSEDGSIGVRVPDSAFTLALGEKFERPYTATSANVAGMPTQSTVEAILAQFGEAASHIALAIDDGPREGNLPSTVVRVRGNEAGILREGALPRELLGL